MSSIFATSCQYLHHIATYTAYTEYGHMSIMQPFDGLPAK